MTLSIPLERIRNDQERSWSFRLLAKLASNENSARYRHEVERTLEMLDDYRLIGPLTELLVDPNQPESVRDSASRILRSYSLSTTAEQRDIWWQSDDEMLMRHAVRMMAQEDSERLEVLASDPDSIFHIDAIECLSSGFEEPRFQLLKIKALRHPDPEVREIAASTLYWAEPVAAEKELLIATGHGDDHVATQALDALCWYQTQFNLLALHRFSQCAPHPRSRQYHRVFEYVRSDFISAIDHFKGRSDPGATEFRQWLEPVWELLMPLQDQADASISDTGNVADAGVSTPPKEETNVEDPTNRGIQSVDEVMRVFSQADVQWAMHEQLFRSTKWESFSDEGKKQLAGFFVSHPDYLVRSLSCCPLATWNEGERLCSMLDDPAFTVRRSAAFSIRRVQPDGRIAKKLWQLLQDLDTTSMYAQEALASYVVHAARDGLETKLQNLARFDPREIIRTRAIYELINLDAKDELTPLLAALLEPPLITWSTHIALINACSLLNMDLSRYLPHLSTIDSLPLQEALANAIA